MKLTRTQSNLSPTFTRKIVVGHQVGGQFGSEMSFTTWMGNLLGEGTLFACQSCRRKLVSMRLCGHPSRDGWHATKTRKAPRGGGAFLVLHDFLFNLPGTKN